MQIKCVDNHSFRGDLLTYGAVLDAGARGFVFSKWFGDRGHTVIALDPSPDIQSEEPYRNVFLKRLALVGKQYPKELYLRLGDDPNAWHVSCAKGMSFESVKVNTVTLAELPYKWDLIKLNIEGSEYEILDEIAGPIARQIVFSFHEHTDRARGREECDRIISKLRTWYDIHNQVWEPRYGCRSNYWDVLAIERGIDA